MASNARSAAQAFFDEVWTPARSAASAGPARLSSASIRTYGWQWKSWCNFLDQAGLRWDRAQPEDLRQFLDSLKSRKLERARAPGQPKPKPQARRASSVTRMRYARALQEIYSAAVIAGRCKANPVPSTAASAPSAQDSASLVLPPQDWRALVEAVRLPREAHWTQARDAALLLVMLQAGLTVGELQRLDLGDAVQPHARGALALSGWSQLALPGLARLPRLSVRADAGAQATARAASRAKSQTRQVPLEPRAAQALAHWMRVRMSLPGAPLEPNSPLFISRKGYGRLAAKSLFLLANRHIAATLAERYAAHGQRLPHSGPSTLRNACIARWLLRLPEDQVVKLAGVQDAAALARLRVTTPSARPTSKKGTP